MKKAFTLAEMLIVISIIGVISVLTIPGLVNSYQKKVEAAQLKSVYSKITDAIQTSITDENLRDFRETKAGQLHETGNCEQGPCYFLEHNFKLISRNCLNASGTTKKCIGASYTNERKNSAGTIRADYCAKTINEAAICIKSTENDYVFYIDVNGEENPNITGRDIYVMKVNSLTNSLIDVSSEEEQCGRDKEGLDTFETGDLARFASGCLTKVINAGWKIE